MALTSESSLVAQKFGVFATEVKSLVKLLATLSRAIQKILVVIRELRGSGLTLYVMSNMSAPDWEFVCTPCTPEQWALFDPIFIS